MRPKTLADILNEAEVDYLLDRPNATVSTRAGAFLLDLILFSILWNGIHYSWVLTSPYLTQMFGSILILFNKITINVSIHHLEFTMKVLQKTLKIFLYVFFFCGTLTLFGATPGKLLLGLRVIDIKTGKKPSLMQAILRETLGKFISTSFLALGWSMSVWRSDHRALHDLLAGTSVKLFITRRKGT